LFITDEAKENHHEVAEYKPVTCGGCIGILENWEAANESDQNSEDKNEERS